MVAAGVALASQVSADDADDAGVDLRIDADVLYLQPGGTLSTSADRIGLDRALGLEDAPGVSLGFSVPAHRTVPVDFEFRFVTVRADETRQADRSFSLVGVDVTDGSSSLSSDLRIDQADFLGVARLTEVFPALNDAIIDLRAGIGLRRVDVEYKLREFGGQASEQRGFAHLRSDDPVLHLAGSYGLTPTVSIGTAITGLPASNREMIDASAWAAYRVTDATRVRLGYRYLGYDFDDEAGVDYAVEAYGGMLGVEHAWGASLGAAFADSDRDGVADGKDRCPSTPAGSSVDAFGCPPDADGDGVANAADTCPGTPAGVVVDASGCVLDGDADGVPDGQDQCPDTRPGQAVEADGCPFDADGDGVMDAVDDCPDTPAGVVVDANGCGADFDGDGIVNGMDQCANTPSGTPVGPDGCETQPLPDSLTSCADTGAEAVGCAAVGDEITVPRIRFASASAELDADAVNAIDTLARVLLAQPTLVIEVQGHTDTLGDEDSNQLLSEFRAQAVVDALTARGVSANRLTANGYGELRPVAANDTAAGRARNRRVVIRVVER